MFNVNIKMATTTTKNNHQRLPSNNNHSSISIMTTEKTKSRFTPKNRKVTADWECPRAGSVWYETQNYNLPNVFCIQPVKSEECLKEGYHVAKWIQTNIEQVQVNWTIRSTLQAQSEINKWNPFSSCNVTMMNIKSPKANALELMKRFHWNHNKSGAFKWFSLNL